LIFAAVAKTMGIVAIAALATTTGSSGAVSTAEKSSAHAPPQTVQGAHGGRILLAYPVVTHSH
jgi:hypothetical protein